MVGVAPMFQGTTFSGLTTLLKGLDFYHTLASLVRPYCEGCVQVVEGSEFLAELHQGGRVVPVTETRKNATASTPATRTVVPLSIKFLMLMSSHDKIVTPYKSGYLSADQVQHVVMEDVCPNSKNWVGRHWTLMFSPISFAIADSFLTPAEARSQIDCDSH